MHTYTVHGTAYTAAELQEVSPSGFQTAYDDWLRYNLDYDWYDCVYDDFVTVAGLMGIEVDPKRIYFSLSYSQSDGASFHGDYQYRKGAAKAIREYAPQDTELHRIADDLQAAQRRYFYKLVATMASHGLRANLQHTDVEHYDGYDVDEEAQDSIDQAMRDLSHWLYCRLRDEADHLNSEESFIDSAEVNGYWFDFGGEMIDPNCVDAA